MKWTIPPELVGKATKLQWNKLIDALCHERGLSQKIGHTQNLMVYFVVCLCFYFCMNMVYFYSWSYVWLIIHIFSFSFFGTLPFSGPILNKTGSFSGSKKSGRLVRWAAPWSWPAMEPWTSCWGSGSTWLGCRRVTSCVVFSRTRGFRGNSGWTWGIS